MRLDPKIIRQQIENLLIQCPELAEDEILRADMIEGQTDAFELLSAIVRKIGDARALTLGLKEYVDEINSRRDRIKRREESLRSLAFKVMGAADLQKAELPEATLSIRKGQPKLIGEPDPVSLPDILCKISREADRTKIKEALQLGAAIEGCELSNAEPSLSIRIK